MTIGWRAEDRVACDATKAYTKDNQNIRAFTSEIVSVFKDIAQLNPLFRDQITNFLINQVTSANIFDEPDKLADFVAAVSSGDFRGFWRVRKWMND
jgi:Lon-like ATP-dependent protease